ncbi:MULTISPECIES: hypothetical protein [unclassified Thioalkalivibrio]|uniref:hypothetical protein n=1 Tax=unclassified Thioalkalivibrio TaxID=2621013 RepID=UPI0003695B97|nr:MULTISPECIES: hypothetical protein [unclassified Thioalkalivibrio]
MLKPTRPLFTCYEESWDARIPAKETYAALTDGALVCAVGVVDPNTGGRRFQKAWIANECEAGDSDHDRTLAYISHAHGIDPEGSFLVHMDDAAGWHCDVADESLGGRFELMIYSDPAARSFAPGELSATRSRAPEAHDLPQPNTGLYLEVCERPNVASTYSIEKTLDERECRLLATLIQAAQVRAEQIGPGGELEIAASVPDQEVGRLSLASWETESGICGRVTLNGPETSTGDGGRFDRASAALLAASDRYAFSPQNRDPDSVSATADQFRFKATVNDRLEVVAARASIRVHSLAPSREPNHRIISMSTLATRNHDMAKASAAIEPFQRSRMLESEADGVKRYLMTPSAPSSQRRRPRM